MMFRNKIMFFQTPNLYLIFKGVNPNPNYNEVLIHKTNVRKDNETIR